MGSDLRRPCSGCKPVAHIDALSSFCLDGGHGINMIKLTNVFHSNQGNALDINHSSCLKTQKLFKGH